MLHLLDDAIAAIEQRLLNGEEAQMEPEHFAMPVVFITPNSLGKWDPNKAWDPPLSGQNLLDDVPHTLFNAIKFEDQL